MTPTRHTQGDCGNAGTETPQAASGGQKRKTRARGSQVVDLPSLRIKDAYFYQVYAAVEVVVEHVHAYVAGGA